MAIQKNTTKASKGNDISYMFSFDKLTWYGNFESRDDAINAGLNNSEITAAAYELIYTAVAENYKPKLDADNAIYSLKTAAAWACSTSPDAEYWLDDATEEQQQELAKGIQSVIDRWLKKHNFMPDFCGAAKNIHPHIIEDFFKPNKK